jgi:hypothetical protein
MTLEAVEFFRRFLLHVLPSGLVRIRQFGFRQSSPATQAGTVPSFARPLPTVHSHPLRRPC